MGNNDNDNKEVEYTDSEKGSNDVKPVKLSRFATTAILSVGIILVIIILLTIKSCSIEKVDTNGIESSISVNSSIEESKSLTENSLIVSEIESSLSNVVSTPVESSKVEEFSEISKEISQTSFVDSEISSNTDVLTEIAIPELSPDKTTSGIVIGKHSFMYKGSYIYNIVVSMLINESTQSIQYFCPKKTFDALNSADTLSITYQYDSNGVISITSIAKK